MSRILSLLTSLLILPCFEIHAQSSILLIDNFDGPNTVCNSTWQTFKFPDSAFPNWKWGWTHGSPSFYPQGQMWLWHNASFINNINSNNGEGIFRNIRFEANTNYLIRIGVNSFVTNGNNSQIPGRIKVKLINSTNPLNNSICPPNQGDPIPNSGIYSSTLDVLPNFAPQFLSNKTIDIAFKTPPGTSYEAIWIYPEDLDLSWYWYTYSGITEKRSPQVELTLECVRVMGCPESNLYYNLLVKPNNSLGKNIYIGNGGSSGSVVNSIGETLLEATEAIEFLPTSNITSNSQNSLLAEIKQCDPLMGIYSYSLTPQYTLVNNLLACAALLVSNKSGLPANSNDEGLKIQEDNPYTNVIIFPNPTYDNLTIRGIRNQQQIGISIRNIEGKEVKYFSPSTYSSDPILDIHELNAGLYFMQIKGDTFSETIKFQKL